MIAVGNVALSGGGRKFSCGAAGIGGVVGVGDVSTAGVARGLADDAGTGFCCCTRPNPIISNGIANTPNARGKLQWVLACGWGGGTGCRVKNVPSVEWDGSFVTIGRLLIKVGGTAASGYFGR